MKEKTSKKILRGRAAGILIEDLDSKLDLILEKVESSETGIFRRIEVLEANLRQEIADVHATLRHQGQKIQKQDEDIAFLRRTSPH